MTCPGFVTFRFRAPLHPVALGYNNRSRQLITLYFYQRNKPCSLCYPRAERRAKRPLRSLFQGLLTLVPDAARSAAGDLALGASPVDRCCKSSATTPVSPPMIRYVTSSASTMLPLQFWRYLVNLAHGDFGIVSQRPAEAA